MNTNECMNGSYERQQANDKRVQLVYVMGDGRSGSTVLDIMLGNHPEVLGVGELNRWPVFEGHPKQGDTKTKVHRFWGEVRDVYNEIEGSLDFSRLEELQDAVGNYSSFFHVLLGLTSHGVRAEYCEYIDNLLEALIKASGKHVVADASKRPGRAWMLLRCFGTRVRVIHLVRDPRGVLKSELKRNVEQTYKSPPVAMLHYLIKNTMSTIVHSLSPRGSALRVRYEDLVREPAAELKRIGRFLDISMDLVINRLEVDGTLVVPPLLDGNRIRRREKITLRLDDEWRRDLSLGHQVLAIMLTLPLFVGYGYWDYTYD